MAIKALKETLSKLDKEGIKIEVLNIGGGYPCNYDSSSKEISLEEISKNIYKEYEVLPHKPRLMLEPGRGMVATTGVLVASVIGRVERKGQHWLFLDAGVYNGLFETMAYQGSTRYKVNILRPSLNSGETLFALAGPTGDSPDIITHEALLPADTDVGDKLAIHDVGAYSLVVTSRFNGFPKPKVYLV
jgi:ornithine decarboxylase